MGPYQSAILSLDSMNLKTVILTVAQKGRVHYQFQHFQLPNLIFLITNFQLGYFSLPTLKFLIFDFQYVHFSLLNLAFLI